MATITVRNLDDEVKELLRVSAAKNGHSMEEEARMIFETGIIEKAAALWVRHLDASTLCRVGRG
jgi:antitoxin FitA